MAVNRLTGLMSGMDTESLVSQLVEARQKKVDTVTKDQSKLKYKQDAWTSLNKKIKSFQSSISNLRFESSFSKRTTSVSDDKVASVITSDDAMLSTQSLKVKSLASAAYLTGGKINADEKLTSGSLLKDLKDADGNSIVGKSITLSSGGKDTTIEITEDMTIGGLASKLSEAGVTAKFDSATQRLFIGAKESGAASDFDISGDSAALKALGLDYGADTDADGKSNGGSAVKLNGSDAEIELNGASFTSSSNTFEINGLTITAKSKTADGEEITLNTTKDTSAMYDMIKKVVNEYSELINEMDKLYNANGEYKKNTEPLTDEEKSAMSDYELEKWEDQLQLQALYKDSSVSKVSSLMEKVWDKGFTVNGKTMYLSDFGVETGNYFSTEDNKKHALHINGDEDDTDYSSKTNTLKYMITSDPDSVTSFFSQLAKEMFTSLDNESKRVTGYRSYGSFFDDVKYKEDYKDYTTKISDMEEKLADYEDKWYSKFASMETAMAKMQSNASAVTGLLG